MGIKKTHKHNNMKTSSKQDESDKDDTLPHPVFELLSFFYGECVRLGDDRHNVHYLPQPLHELHVDGA